MSIAVILVNKGLINMEEYIEIKIKEIVDNGVEAEYKGEIEFFHQFAFIEYEILQIGDLIKLKYDKRKEKYNQFSLLFDSKYCKNTFEMNKVYQAFLVKKISNFYVVRIDVDKNRYGRIYKEEMTDTDHEIGDIIDVTLKGRYQSTPVFSMYDANFLLFKNEFGDEERTVSMEIIKIEKEVNQKKNIQGYQLYTKLGLRIFIPVFDEVLFEKNYNFMKNVLFLDKNLIYNFVYNPQKEWFALSIEENLDYQLNIDELHYGKLDFSKVNNKFYIETDLGYCEFIDSNLRYIEKSILKHLDKKFIPYRIGSDYHSNKKIYLFRIPDQIVENLRGKELKDVEVLDIIETNIDKKLYVLDINDGMTGFMESADYAYDNSRPLVGDIIEKVSVKDVLNNYFIFTSRKCYLIDPKVKFFRDRKVGQSVKARVKYIYDQFITVTVGEFIDIPVLKEDILPLNFFEIEEFFHVGSVYDFYISRLEPDLKLLGYDPNKYKKKEQHYLNSKGNIISGKIYKKMATKYIVRLEEYIEAYLPIDEVSHLDEDRDNLKLGSTNYNFKILNVDIEYGDRLEIMLSRKQLSDTTYAYKRLYKEGSKVEGTYFYRDQDGFYFNLKHNGIEVKGLVGFLENSEVSYYPELDKFQEWLVNNDGVELEILAYPGKLPADPFLKQKCIKLSRKQEYDFNLYAYYKDIVGKKLFLKMDELLDEGLSYRQQPNRVYFSKREKGNKVVFSLKEENFLPGLDLQEDFSRSFRQYLCYLISYVKDNYSNFRRKEKELARIILNTEDPEELDVDSFILSNLKKDYFNKYNNTIEVDYAAGVYREIRSTFDEIEVEVMEDDETGFYASLINKNFGIRVNILNENLVPGKSYSIVIVDYNKSKNLLIAEVNSLTKDCIGQVYPVRVIEQIDENRYRVKYLGNKYADLICNSQGVLLDNEIIYARLDSLSGDQAIFCYEFNLETILENINDTNLNRYAYKDMLGIIRDRSLILELGIEEILIVYKALRMKKQRLGLKNDIDFRKVIFLLENGFKRGEYVFGSNVYGRGNFGLVFKGINLIDGKRVICKRYTSDREFDEERARFEKEALVLKELELGGVPKVYSYLKDNNEYIADYISGKTLREYIQENDYRDYKWKKDKYINLLIDIADRVDELSMEGIVHCDLKPENIIYNERDELISIIDFGSIHTDQQKGGFGTIFYSSPAQCNIYSNPHLHNTEEHKFETRDDIYTFGVIMYELFAGRLPYGKELEEETIIIAHQFGQLHDDAEYTFRKPSYYNSQIEEDIEKIILKCMAVDRLDRYRDFYDIVTDLKEVKKC